MVAKIADKAGKAAITQCHPINVDHGIRQPGVAEQSCKRTRFDPGMGPGGKCPALAVGGVQGGTQSRQALSTRKGACQQSTGSKPRRDDPKQEAKLVAGIELTEDKNEIEAGFLLVGERVDTVGKANLLADAREPGVQGRRQSRHQYPAEPAADRHQSLKPLVDDPLGQKRTLLAGKSASPALHARGVIEQGLGHAPLWECRGWRTRGHGSGDGVAGG